MSTVKLELQLSSQELLMAVEQLNGPELEEFVSQIIILHTQKKSDLLLKQEQEKLLDIHNYYNRPNAKIAQTMTENEYKELLRLSEQIDKLQAHRFEYLTEIADLHGVSLTELMNSLGFQA
ncbi:MAG: STAS/SEC14 domain-containing protein [Sphaerospermopsis sp. SIO1G2]|nr:STAS/SEC14 domain-containing protein [Sphaerospermopsis sp. SIO1G1]NET72805.1 STAS/SEC14 domain-containing protein [Sphaerospermopsis sp. SIO1G2]